MDLKECELIEMENEGHVMDLPEEIRGVIFNKLPQKQALQLRLVCRKWRNEIDTFFDFIIELDERCPYFQWILQLRIKECKIVQFLEPPLPSDGIPFFKYPALLRILDISSNRNAKSTISPDNFHNLFKFCGEHLENISVRLTVTLLSHTFPLNTRYNLENLRKLELFVDARSLYDNYAVDTPTFEMPPDNVLSLLIQHSRTPKLKVMIIHFNMFQPASCSRLIASVLRSISVPRLRPLGVLKITLVPFETVSFLRESRPSPPTDLESIDLKTVDSLKEMKIDLALAIAVDCWLQLLRNQKKLEYVEIGSNDCVPVPSLTLRELVLNNWETLVSIDILHLKIEKQYPEDEGNETFDMSIFQYCHNLQKLCLRGRRTRPSSENVQNPDLINLFYLPLFMAELHLVNLQILTDDLLSLSCSPRELGVLTLRNCGDAGAFGVDVSVLERLVSLRTLALMKFHKFNVSVIEESIKLQEIFPKNERIHSAVHRQGFVTLSRNADSSAWELQDYY